MADAVTSESFDAEFFFSFGMFHFFKTVGTYRVAKDESIGACVPKQCQSFVLSTFHIDPVFCILTLSIPFGEVPVVVLSRHKVRPLRFIHGIHHCEEYGLSSFFRIFSSCNPTRLDNGTTIMRRTNETDELKNPSVRNCHVILQ